MTFPSTGKVPPRVIAAAEPVASARGPASAAAVVATLAALVAGASLAFDTVASSDGAGPNSGVAIAAIASTAPFVVVAVLSIMFVRSSPALVGALTAGFASVALGSVVLDLGLLVSPIDANRLEFFRPITAAMLSPGVGAYSVLAAHLSALIAGLFGLAAIGRASFHDGYGSSIRADRVGRASAVRIGGVLTCVIGVAALVAAASMFAPAYVSTDSIVLVPAVVESPLTTSVGSGLIALGVVVLAASALASVSPVVAGGALVGGGLALLGISATRVVAGSASGPGIGPSSGAWVGTAAAVVLVGAGISAPLASSIRDRQESGVVARRTTMSDPGVTRWHVVAGISGVVAGMLLAAGALLPILDVPDGLADPSIAATRVSVIAGVVLVMAAVPMFFSVFAASVRPALGVLTVAAVASAAAVLQAVVLATDIDGVSPGLGGYATGAGALAATLCGVAVLVAGSAERDDVDTSDVDVRGGPMVWVGAASAAVGLVLPLYSNGPSVLDWPWGWDTWGRVVLAVTIVLTAYVSARSRPQRAMALLVGAVAAMVLYLLAWPLIGPSSIGAGLVAGVVGTLILAVAAALSRDQARE